MAEEAVNEDGDPQSGALGGRRRGGPWRNFGKPGTPRVPGWSWLVLWTALFGTFCGVSWGMDALGWTSRKEGPLYNLTWPALHAILWVVLMVSIDRQGRKR